MKKLSECRCACHRDLVIHVAACCEPDITIEEWRKIVEAEYALGVTPEQRRELQDHWARNHPPPFDPRRWFATGDCVTAPDVSGNGRGEKPK